MRSAVKIKNDIQVEQFQFSVVIKAAESFVADNSSKKLRQTWNNESTLQPRKKCIDRHFRS